MSGSATGVYIGASTTDYSDLRIGDPAGADSYFMTGSTLSILANRISYVFDLRGPSLAVDTACSSSLVALHHACEAIRNKRIAAAIVGGINLLLAPYPFIGFSRASMLSRRGRCFAFDERADGYVRGEGGAVIILKPLADAVAAKDRIRAVIRASAVNSDGRTIGLSLPSESAQASLLRAVYRYRRDCSGRSRIFSKCTAPARRRATRSRPPRSDTLWVRVGRFRCRSDRSRPISATWSRRQVWPGCSRRRSLSIGKSSRPPSTARGPTRKSRSRR